VKQRKRDHDGNPVGHSHPNPLLDTREYEVEFPDGSINVLLVDVIAEAMYSPVNEQGWSYAVLSDCGSPERWYSIRDNRD
jgi:hypothetical protein